MSIEHLVDRVATDILNEQDYRELYAQYQELFQLARRRSQLLNRAYDVVRALVEDVRAERGLHGIFESEDRLLEEIRVELGISRDGDGHEYETEQPLVQ